MSTPTSPAAPVEAGAWTVVDQDVWTAREARHQERVDALLADHLHRRAHGITHPVNDFLFTYYSHKPAQLRRWHPGAGTLLLGDAARTRAAQRWHTEVSVPSPHGGTLRGAGLDAAAFRADRARSVDFVTSLLSAVQSRPANIGCFGLHEWAMVYRLDTQQVRHSSVPLRLSPEATDRVVESHRVQCSHFDAFRFFTPDARPHNRLQPTRESQVDFDQPGCLHANMDLYKWSYKLVPAAPGELVVDCFELAKDIRELDMRASPYDLSGYGYTPVRIETPEGKAEYMAAQQDFADRAADLRTRLLHVCRLLGAPASPAESGDDLP